MNINSFMTGVYEKKDNWLMGKTSPIQTQLLKRVKLMQSVYIQRIMKKNSAMGYKKTNPTCSELVESKQTQSPNDATTGRKMFLLFFFLNLMVGYADKNVWKFCNSFVMNCKTKNMDLLFIRKEGD